MSNIAILIIAVVFSILNTHCFNKPSRVLTDEDKRILKLKKESRVCNYGRFEGKEGCVELGCCYFEYQRVDYEASSGNCVSFDSFIFNIADDGINKYIDSIGATEKVTGFKRSTFCDVLKYDTNRFPKLSECKCSLTGVNINKYFITTILSVLLLISN